MSMTWVLESNVLPTLHFRLRRSAARCSQRVVAWQDMWRDAWPELEPGFVVFHGSLETAALVSRSAPWSPGAYCTADAFACSFWYPCAEKWLLHRSWARLSVQELVADPAAAFRDLGDPAALFVRPDSALKPFSGRVLARGAVTLGALDHGFYYDDTSLPVVLAPVRSVEKEWRYVVVHKAVVAGSAYHGPTRSATPDDPRGEPWSFAAAVARDLPEPEAVYTLDVCECDGCLWLLELNPFSGADLYGCDTDAIVRSIGDLA